MTAVAVGVVTAFVLWILAAHDRLLELRDDTREAWTRVSADLTRRHDIVVDLVREVRDVADVEPELLERALTITGAARQAVRDARPDRGVRRVARTESALSEILSGVKVALTRFPDWHPRLRIHSLLDELSRTEHAAADHVRGYNEQAQRLNGLMGLPAWAVVSGIARLRSADYWVDPQHTSSGPAPSIQEHPLPRRP